MALTKEKLIQTARKCHEGTDCSECRYHSWAPCPVHVFDIINVMADENQRLTDMLAQMWIPCAERLPAVDLPMVLVRFTDGTVLVAQTDKYFAPANIGFDEGLPAYTHLFLEAGVTHWLQLPPQLK